MKQLRIVQILLTLTAAEFFGPALRDIDEMCIRDRIRCRHADS